MSIHLEALTASKKVLFLQGPMGGFFNQVAKWLSQKNIDTYKINLNGGDWFFTQNQYYKVVLNYSGSLGEFDKWLHFQIKDMEIDAIVCFGDCRKYHLIAKHISEKLQVNFFVFEEGYIRPNFITFEQDGVNSFSKFKCDFSKDIQQDQDELMDGIQSVENKYYKMVQCAIVYYSFTLLLRLVYRNYQHHRGISARNELFAWLVSGCRRIKNALTEPALFTDFQNKYIQQYFVFPLQVHNDSQILVHSELKSMDKYIDYVLRSFSENAVSSHHLVVKHHPMDRGYRHYAALIKQLSAEYGITGRVHYFCDIHLPTLLKNSLGLVTVNSTTGLQALYHEVPVKVLGRALYNVSELTFQNHLDLFWTQYESINEQNYNIFRHELIGFSQLNGAYYGKIFWNI